MKVSKSVARLTRNPWLASLLVLLLVFTSFSLEAVAVTGNIQPDAIQVDGPLTGSPGADHFDDRGTPLNAGAAADWVKDTQANTDPASLVNSIATGITPGVTGKAGGTGHWNGVRIVDGIAGNDQDIFLTGGKENDTTTWNVGPGTVGSSKYDMTQGYLASNQEDLFFGMERRGNNGTTAFDFEFNQVGTAGGYIPTRTVGDILFTFEMQGSGGSGSAVGFVYEWDGNSYEPIEATGLLATINDSTSTPAPPWGHVDSRGNWVGGNLARFEFAEAKAPLSVLDVNACDDAAFVQVRTRSSSTETSDLKDTTKIFEYSFGGPTAAAAIGTNCEQQFTYDGAGSVDSSGGSDLDYDWDISVSPTTATLSGGGVTATDTAGVYDSTQASGTVDVALPNGVDSAVVTVKNTVAENGSCLNSTGDKTVTVYRELGATATLTAQCDNQFDYSSTVSGGKGPYTYAWTFQKSDGNGGWTNVATSSTASGTFDASASGQGTYRAQLTVTDTEDGATNGKGICETNATSNEVTVYDAVGGTVALDPDCDDTFGYSAAGSGGKAPYTYDFTVQKLVNGTYMDAGEFTRVDTLADPGVSGELDSDDYGGNGTYRLLVTITDSQGLECLVEKAAGPIQVADELTASAEKASANRSTLTANMSGSAPTADALQWQIKKNGAWVDISSATAATLGYSSFEADTSPTVKDFTLDGFDFKGQIWSVELRLKATRTLNGDVCVAYSSEVPVKMLKAVDP